MSPIFALYYHYCPHELGTRLFQAFNFPGIKVKVNPNYTLTVTCEEQRTSLVWVQTLTVTCEEQRARAQMRGCDWCVAYLSKTKASKET